MTTSNLRRDFNLRSVVRPLSAIAIAIVLLLSVSGALHASEADASWPQWLGPDSRAHASDGGVPATWSETDNLMWKLELEGLGHSSPVLWGDLLFVTTAIEGDVIDGAAAPEHTFGGQSFKHPAAVGADKHQTLKVIAVDRTNGKVQWEQVAYAGRVYDDRHQMSSYASPTAATDGERVYAYFGSEGLYAYDFAGELVWKRDIGDIKSVGLGIGTSPVLFEDLLIVQADEDSGDESFVVALEAKSGDEVWRTSRSVQASWTTPIIVPGGDDARDQLITSGNELVISYDPRTGEEIWRAKGLESNAVHTPLYDNGVLVLTAGYPQKVVLAIDPRQEGDLTDQDPYLWRYNKGPAYVPSNVLADGLLYMMNDTGVMTCLDAKTGEIVYEGGRFPGRGRFTASMLVVGDKILQLNEAGTAAFIKRGREHEVVSSAELDDTFYATPAVSGANIYLRGRNALYAIGSN